MNAVISLDLERFAFTLFALFCMVGWGDMYESTVDVLYFLYGKLSIGGYVIMDDVM